MQDELEAQLPPEALGRYVFGTPVEMDGTTVIPAATVQMGGGSADGNGSYGVTAKPAGAYVITNGSVSWQPAVDVTKLILAGAIAPTVAALIFGTAAILRARRHPG